MTRDARDVATLAKDDESHAAPVQLPDGSFLSAVIPRGSVEAMGALSTALSANLPAALSEPALSY